MRRLAALLLTLGIAPAATAHAAGEVFTLAGDGTTAGMPDGGRATAGGLALGDPIAPLPQGGFLIGDGSTVIRVDPQGTAHVVAGSGDTGSSGDGGPAVKASLSAAYLAALPGGGFLLSDNFAGDVRMVDANGIISTLASGLENPFEVAPTPGGGFVVDLDRHRVVRFAPDGRSTTIAGDGSEPIEPPSLHGQPATSVGLSISDLDVAPDGSVLIAEGFFGRVDRVAPDGSITTLAKVPADSIAALPGGGFLAAEDDRVEEVGPDGSRVTLAGGARAIATAPRGLQQRLTGEPASGMELQDTGDIAAMPDGGVLFTTDENDRVDYGAVVHYLAPAAPGVLAVALLRDRDRVFTPGRAGHVSVALTLPATVTLTVAGRTSTATLPAGLSRLPLPKLRPGQHQVSISAADAAGRRAFDRARVYPPGWLPDATAQLVAGGVRTRVLHIEDPQAGSCSRFGAARVDCDVAGPDYDPCRRVTIVLSRQRLAWGVHSCRTFGRARVLHPLRRQDWACQIGEKHCLPRLFGRVSEAALVPSS